MSDDHLHDFYRALRQAERRMDRQHALIIAAVVLMAAATAWIVS